MPSLQSLARPVNGKWAVMDLMSESPKAISVLDESPDGAARALGGEITATEWLSLQVAHAPERAELVRGWLDSPASKASAPRRQLLSRISEALDAFVADLSHEASAPSPGR